MSGLPGRATRHEPSPGNQKPFGPAWGASFSCALGTLVSYSPIVVLTLPILLKPISGEFGWSRSLLSSALLVASVAAAVVSPLIGRLVDRWGARRVVLPGLLLFAGNVAALSVLDGTPWMLYWVFATLGVVQTACGQIAYNKVVSAWFNKTRGLALGLTVGAAMSIGNGAAPQVARMLLADHGWRGTYALLGLTILCVFPAMWLLLREPTLNAGEEHAAGKADVAPAHQGLSARAAASTANFWLILTIVSCFWFAVNGLRVHLVALYTDRGRSAMLASNVLTLWSLGAFAGHILIGHALDRISTPRIAIPSFFAALAGLLMLDHGESIGVVTAGALLIGLGMGAEVTLAPYFVSRFFGMRAAAEIYAYVTIFTTVAGGLGPYVMGLSFDFFGSYRPGLTALTATLAGCAVMGAFLTPYRFTARQASVTKLQ